MSTLGFHRDMAAVVFGEASGATRYLDARIETDGRDAEVVCSEEQLLCLLVDLHASALDGAMPGGYGSCEGRKGNR